MSIVRSLRRSHRAATSPTSHARSTCSNIDVRIALVGGEIDHLVEEIAELDQLGADRAEDLIPILGREVTRTFEHRDVGTKARQRRPHFVAGIVDQPVLLHTTRFQRVEHRGEAARKSADLVVPAVFADIGR